MPAPHREGVSTWPALYRHTAPPATPPIGPSTLWRRDAACQDSGEDFVEVTRSEGLELADAYCAGCPVLDACADYGRRTRAYGVWGGHVLDAGRKGKARTPEIAAT